MTFMPRVEEASAAEWSDLVAELDRWEETGHVASLWWRDDDAVAPTAKLDRLLAVAGGAPIALAVIPACAEAGLASALDEAPQVAVLQHGWRHANHALTGKKSEYPPERSVATVASELTAGRARLHALFAARALPVLVPPWNRFAAGFVPLLTEAGIAGLSQIAPRKGPDLPGGLIDMDVHVDIVAWREHRGFIGDGVALGRLIAELRARRWGGADPFSAVGVLTHHLVMDEATADFMARLSALIIAHRAARWVGAGEILVRQ